MILWIKKKKTFSFTVNGTHNNKERETGRRKEKKKERGKISECSMVVWGVLEEWCKILQGEMLLYISGILWHSSDTIIFVK